MTVTSDGVYDLTDEELYQQFLDEMREHWESSSESFVANAPEFADVIEKLREAHRQKVATLTPVAHCDICYYGKAQDNEDCLECDGSGFAPVPMEK
jgi:hypothetical protein